MPSAKEIILKVIPSKIANSFVRKYHYSGSIVSSSTLHFGAFLENTLHGVMSYGSPMDKRKMMHLVKTAEGNNCSWNDMLELNRMAFDDYLPRNSESRCIAISFKLIRKYAPHIKWILSFSDGSQCGDGTIYRASGFMLTGIKKNKQTIRLPDGEVVTKMTLTIVGSPKRAKVMQQFGIIDNGKCSMKPFFEKGAKAIEGFQLRYIYLLDKSCKLNCNVLPFSAIADIGAKMYKGIKQ